jgi:hypothetical protein
MRQDKVRELIKARLPICWVSQSVSQSVSKGGVHTHLACALKLYPLKPTPGQSAGADQGGLPASRNRVPDRLLHQPCRQYHLLNELTLSGTGQVS